MAISLVSHTSIVPAGTTGGTSGNISTSGATLFIVVTSGSVAAVPTDSTGANTYTSIGQIGNGFSVISTYYCYNPTTSGSMNWSVSAANSSACIATFSGVLTSSGYDSGAASGGTSSSSTTVQPGSVTPAVNGELLITGLSIAGASGSGVTGVDNSFSITDSFPFSAGLYYGTGLAWRVQNTAAAINPTWTLSATPLAMGAQISGYKADPVSPSVNLDGVSATAAAGTLSADTAVNVALNGVSATAAVGSLSISAGSSVTLTGAAATTAVGSFATGINHDVSLSGVSATSAAGSFALAVTSTVALTGVEATAGFGLLPPTQVLVTVPILTIMNDNPIPVEGDMVGDYVPMEEDMPNQIALETVLNTFPIPMTGTLSAVPIPAEGSVP